MSSLKYKAQKNKGIPPTSKKRRQFKKRKKITTRALYLSAYGIFLSLTHTNLHQIFLWGTLTYLNPIFLSNYWICKTQKCTSLLWSQGSQGSNSYYLGTFHQDTIYILVGCHKISGINLPTKKVKKAIYFFFIFLNNFF